MFSFNPKKIPVDAGCYLFYDSEDQLLYVGKAKNLRKRVSSYFQKEHESERTKVMTKKISRIETQKVNNENEALILENELIKQKLPRYNVKLRDDKNFLYLHVTGDQEPKMEITRRIDTKSSGTYFGPKTNTKATRNLARFCQKFFGIRMVRPSDDYYPLLVKNKFKTPEEYRESVGMMKKFLRGNTTEIEKILREKITKFAEKKNFEAAAKTRDTLQSILTSSEKQRIIFEEKINGDFLNFFRQKDRVFLVRISFRGGKWIDQNEIEFSAQHFETDAEILEKIIIDWYPRVTDLPNVIALPEALENEGRLINFWQEKIASTGTIKFFYPQKGNKKAILDLAKKSAENFCHTSNIEAMSHAEVFSLSLPDLAKALQRKKPLTRIECYDVSHFSGMATVASGIIFLHGEPKKSEYKRYHIKSLPLGKIDDFASMAEVISRRFAPPEGKIAKKKFRDSLPDLIIIDGGKGQLSAALEAFDALQKPLKKYRLNGKKLFIGLAKKEEEVFFPEKSEPLRIPHSRPALKLLQRIRDEAHRFAITFNRSVREKSAKKSVLDEISGIGPTTKKKLLQTFGSVGDIRKADDEALLNVLNQKQLQSLRSEL